MPDEEFVQVMTTTDSKDEATKLARAAVEARLAACVQINTITSTYWWNNEVETADEYILAMKTPRRLFPQLADFIKSQHTYDVPEITALPIIDGSQDYLAWIDAETLSTSG